MSATTKDADWDANASVPEGCDDSSRSAASSLLDDICRLVALPCISTTVGTTRPCRFSDRFLDGRNSVELPESLLPGRFFLDDRRSVFSTPNLSRGVASRKRRLCTTSRLTP